MNKDIGLIFIGEKILNKVGHIKDSIQLEKLKHLEI